MNVANGHADNRLLGEVTHGRQQMCSTRFGDSSARAPEVAMENKHLCSDGPAEKNFAVLTDALICEDAVHIFFDPIDHILPTARPEETHANPEESLINTKVTTNGAAMEHVEDKAAEGRRNNYKKQGSAGLQALTNNEAAMMNTQVDVLRKLLECRMEYRDEQWAPGNT